MIKFSLYRQKSLIRDRLICNKTNYKGEVTVLRDFSEFDDIVLRFLKGNFRIMISGDTLYLFNKSTIFELLKFPEIINSGILAKIKQGILTKISEEDLVPEEKVQGSLKNPVFNPKVGAFIGTKVLPIALAIYAVALFSSFSTDAGAFDKDDEENKDDTQNFSQESFEFVLHPEPFSYSVFMNKDFIKNTEFSKFYDLNSILDSLKETDEEVVETEPVIEESQEPEITFAEKSLVVRQRDYLTNAMLDKLLISMCDGSMPGVSFASSDEALDYLYENVDRTYPEKMLIVMIRESLSYSELDDICAGCVAEGGEYYDECYRVASVGYNRYHSINFVNYFGYGLYTQYLAPSQFSVFYGKKTYLTYKGRIDSVGYQAALDMFYSREISTDYLSFRGWWKEVPDDWESFMYHGNQFGNHQSVSDIYKLDYEYTYEEEMVQDIEAMQDDMSLERKLENLD